MQHEFNIPKDVSLTPKLQPVHYATPPAIILLVNVTSHGGLQIGVLRIVDSLAGGLLARERTPISTELDRIAQEITSLHSAIVRLQESRTKSNSSEKLTQLLGKTFGTLNVGDVTAVGYQRELSLL